MWRHSMTQLQSLEMQVFTDTQDTTITVSAATATTTASRPYEH